ncbi:Rossmann fold domain-containing protein [Erythrobacter sp. A6_0]|uniref:Rossmann fold domain-containing protein n=1 Tax=Erythrobacter sp. A6_0 TaxID=2821089 RepID=UPI001ADAD111|nr:hypothetical protein [Erythrobacter sp. A6_0]MBO9511084.1 hypothetical protein [Erythrobacter sp. A6_0]
MRRVTLADLPEAPLAASGAFHHDHLASVEAIMTSGEDVMIALPPADHTHREWRLALATGLARAHAPARANVVAGHGDALDAFEAYLGEARGITGQYLEGDGQGAGDPAQ